MPNAYNSLTTPEKRHIRLAPDFDIRQNLLTSIRNFDESILLLAGARLLLGNPETPPHVVPDRCIFTYF